MRTLNFYPYYERYLSQGVKTTTIRLGRPDLAIGDQVMLTIGWSEDKTEPVRTAQIVAVYSKRIGELTADDFEGESPDCLSPEPTALVISAIYRTVVTVDTDVWVVKFRHL